MMAKNKLAIVHDKTGSLRLLEHVPCRIISVSDMELVPFLKDNEINTECEEMARRARMLGADLGLEDAEFMFKHQNEIPVEFRGFHLIFPGTIMLTDPWNGRPQCCIPRLICDVKLWSLGFYRLWPHFNAGFRLVRPRRK
jgi:hypothetical protein